MGAHPNTRPLCLRALTQLRRSRISWGLLLQTLSNWDKTKWIRYLTCANGMFVHKGLQAALSLRWAGKNKVCAVKLNFAGNTQRDPDLWELLVIVVWGGCWEGSTPPIAPTHPPQPHPPRKRKKRKDTKHICQVIKWLHLIIWASGSETLVHASESPAGLLKPRLLGPTPRAWVSRSGVGLENLHL